MSFWRGRQYSKRSRKTKTAFDCFLAFLLLVLAVIFIIGLPFYQLYQNFKFLIVEIKAFYDENKTIALVMIVVGFSVILLILL
jgi:hypothetical protein